MVEAKDPAARNGLVHSHRFPGANTALPFVNGDQKQLETVQAFLKDNQVSVDVFGLVRGGNPLHGNTTVPSTAEPRLSSTFAVGEESMASGVAGGGAGPALPVLAPLDVADPVVRRGESVRLDVVLRTRKVGHFFPGGTVDAFDVWVELEGRDETGRLVFHSGRVEDGGKGPVELGAHFYRSVMLDENGNRIDKRNAWATRSVAYVRLVPPGAADTVRFRVVVPPDCGERITFTARVNYRKFAWWNTQWSYAGVRDPGHVGFSLAPGHDDGRWVFTGDTSTVSGKMKSIPDIPITVMAERRVTLRVVPAGSSVAEDAPHLVKDARDRFNDYGIGLLLQGDLKAAEAAFLNVTKIDPGYADGYVNVARARLQEGDLDGASAALEEALRLSPQLAKAHFFLATVKKQRGQYDEALTHLKITLEQYPKDRVVRNQLGRVLFLKRQHAEALTEFRKVLEIDPEDLTAHYNMMLCYQGLGDAENSARERKLYERFKADESSQSITGAFRKLHPEDNNERQSVHEHVSVALGGAPTEPYAAKKKSGGTASAQPPTVSTSRRSGGAVQATAASNVVARTGTDDGRSVAGASDEAGKEPSPKGSGGRR
jgi:tetratricopeptide (TPR) repeat protein